MNKLAIAIIALLIAALVGVLWFRADRLDASDLAEIADAQKRIEELKRDEAPAATAESSASSEEAEKQKEEKPLVPGQTISNAELARDAQRALETESEKAAPKGAPPAITIVPNESMPKETPEKFTVMFETTKGDFAVEFHRDWAPNGANRIYELMMIKFFTDMRLFRMVEGFVVQFGISGDPMLSRKWMNSNIPDDKPTQSNTEGMFTFAAASMPNSRSTQVFINLGDNSNLDRMGFAPVGKVIFGMDVVKSFYGGYGEEPSGLQERIGEMGNKFLDKEFPELDSIKRAVFIEEIIDMDAVAKQKHEENLQVLRERASGSITLGVSERAPDVFRVNFESSRGMFVVECTREWSPNGADRFYTLVKNGFYDGAKFFRVVPNYIVQFGLPAKPDLTGKWLTSYIEDDPFKISNTQGTLSFAKPNRPNMRATQIFINYKDNPNLDERGFTPFAKVIEGMDVVNQINAEYGEQPNQTSVRGRGNEYLENEFPRLDGIVKATIAENLAPASADAVSSAPDTNAAAATEAPVASEQVAPPAESPTAADASAPAEPAPATDAPTAAPAQ
ncbi:MAG: peptidylprolyl isomerase [Candidatus Hydrogenedentes bacterium]|nr:peptidylprolyl isomerase [Candidatus Hydrogenedentota bacterium]